MTEITMIRDVRRFELILELVCAHEFSPTNGKKASKDFIMV